MNGVVARAGNRARRRAGGVFPALAAVLLALAGLAAAPTATARQAAPDFLWHFASRPDLLAPKFDLRTTGATAPGHLFLGPKTDTAAWPPIATRGGPEILDGTGQPVWFHPRGDGNLVRTAAFERQEYRGRPVLTWWEGVPVQLEPIGNPAFGKWVVMDQSYQVIAEVHPGNGLRFADLHDMRITPQGTALLLVYRPVPGVVDGRPQVLMENTVQEVEIGTGRVLMQWDGLDHVDLAESYFGLPDNPLTPYQYLHLNSLFLDHDGDVLVSSRHTGTVYKIDRASGAVVWRLGGKNSDFAFGPGAAFSWQHDVAREPDGTLSLFDNAAPSTGSGGPVVSRGLVLSLDEARGTASVVRSDPSPERLLTGTQGSTQVLPGGHLLVGWGGSGRFTEFGPDGSVVLAGAFAKPGMNSYRAQRFPWVGRPLDPPAVAARAGTGGTTVYASWNGATEVASWRVLAGVDGQEPRPVTVAPRSGFETAVPIPRAERVAVQALDTAGNVLGTSPTVRVG
ncbi:arylsulfotransferase family protein [Actinosynnema sp. NPDC023587]|uniref:arylsulfotransferase family protein n=1 Tax=Actinosynnema sp. NPDC023587 TaxID=3154695 RepID=UPI0033D09E93